MISQVVALLFIACVILNATNNTKAIMAAIMFAFAHIINTTVTYDGSAFYYYAGSSAMALLVYTFLVSSALWSRLLTIILLSSIFVSLLGVVNVDVWHSESLRDLIYSHTILATFLELVVLVMMSTRILDLDKPNSFRQFRESILRGFSSRSYHFTDKAQAR